MLMAGRINFFEGKSVDQRITKTGSSQILKCSEFHHIIEQPLFSFLLNQYLIYMFSGIVEEMATVVAIKRDKGNIDLTMECSFTNELKIDQSISHNGVCLTVVEINGNTYTVTAMKETLDRSNLGKLEVGDHVNVERSMIMNGRLDGHIVQGHVDETAKCINIKDADGSTYFTFEYKLDK